ncbi:MFS transporter [Rhizorhabdus wittichii]|jgi:MFS family permease|uniref:MFS transporter n=1 Tax=Rhizorhabdus wittichii TaxID=160791 RepID=A0A975D067_9SPHN|nr:MFS transporter [Rhizorhabdus wittichii]QTH20284.1 MFS transporter [Rhizorhabdus wittichii]
MNPVERAVATETGSTAPHKAVGRYAWYVLGVLILVYALNFIDRQILSILAQNVKRDLDLTDAQLGFLYGTAFAIFYATFGIPLGRLADRWNRVTLLALGLAIWSAMTVLSGFSESFGELAFARIGVGIGEASAAPAAFSLIAAYFPKEKRGFALSIYATGAYIGFGISLPLGGWIADSWDASYALRAAPLGLAGWQAAFIAVGLPGLLLAVWVFSLREPARTETPQSAGLPGVSVFRMFGRDLASVIPPFTLWNIARYPGELSRNIAALGIVALVSAAMIWLTGDYGQWIALAIGVYAIISWIQDLRYSDRPAFHLICADWALPLCLLSFGCIALLTYSAAFWAAPYAIRTFGMSATAAGSMIGVPGAIASALGILAGGRLSDIWKARDPRGRIFTCMIGAALPIPLIALMYTRVDLQAYLLISPAVYFVTAVTGGVCVAACQDLVLPRMYGTVGSVYLVGTTMIGLALGPYGTGKIATITGSLQTGVLSMLLITPITLTALWFLSRRTTEAEATRFERARLAGEA